MRVAGGRDATAHAARGQAQPRRLVARTMVAPPLADQGRRLRLGTALVLVLFLVIAGRLVQFQLTDAPAYAAKGLELRLQPVDLPAPRGSILDRSGAVLAGSAEAQYVYADPDLVKDPIATADVLSPILGVPRSELVPKLVPHRFQDGSPVRFEYLARGVPVDMGQQVSDLDLAGIGVRRDESRVVPGHDLAANLIGFTGRDLTGLGGLEASYDQLLRGVDGRRVFEIGQPDGDVDLDHEIPGGHHEETPARPGSSLRLTIDRDLQFEVQRILGARMAQVRATSGSAVVLDARTGEILAQASYPFYDAANPFASPPADRGDAATGMALDPGSVHKAVVVAACLQEGIVAPGDSVVVEPGITKGSVTFTDTHPHSQPTAMTLPGILAWSSNVGTITLADRLGAQKLYEYQRAFGLGEPTGAGLPAESAGLVQPPEHWSAESAGSIPIGMGVSVTPLQMAAVYAAIANGGVWVQPHLVQAVISPDGATREAPVAPPRRVISAENAAALRTMLEAVVTVRNATGLSAKVPDYRVAGKTGTGKLVQDGQYASGEVASFIGMAPADAPRYVIAVFANTPGGNGGQVAGPAFAEMMEYTLRHYRVAPTGTQPPTFSVYP
jgi:cell division protein FtsI (penicillin-binding protein 3)